MADENLRILIVGAHPADVFDTAGGTLAHHAARGDKITALVLTQGARVHDVVITGELAMRESPPSLEELGRLLQERTEVKRQEVRDACALLDFSDVRFLDFDEDVLVPDREMVLSIAQVIRDVRPHIAITHYPLDDNGIANQHATTGQLVLSAINAAAGIGRDDPNLPHRVAQVFFMATPIALPRTNTLSAEVIGYPDIFVDITDVVERKVAAMMCLESQQYDEALARKRIESVDGCLGFFMRVPYAEAFIRYRSEIYHTLPLGPTTVERASELEGETHVRMNMLTSLRVAENT